MTRLGSEAIGILYVSPLSRARFIATPVPSLMGSTIKIDPA
jgi:hypothetical protein